ncbi:MAG: c-type cytochrome, partial [Bacteroidia bacterium]|nr:c-type cytochrome [Bacteroidia bacterium]
AWHKTFMWDGAVNHLDVQSLFPITHPAEMDEKIEHIVKKLQESTIYPALFNKAYNDSNITGERVLKSISQFMLTLISANSKYDSVMRKEKQFNEQEQKGYALFKQHCSTCHTEPLFTNLAFENNGLTIDTSLLDYGRIKITKKEEDSLKFKVPTLRNIEFSYPYMHDGRFKSISEVLKHYTNDVQHHPTTSDKVKNIKLSSNEKVDLTSFLLTLTDKTFLFDKQHAYPKYIFRSSTKE